MMRSRNMQKRKVRRVVTLEKALKGIRVKEGNLRVGNEGNGVRSTCKYLSHLGLILSISQNEKYRTGESIVQSGCILVYFVLANEEYFHHDHLHMVLSTLSRDFQAAAAVPAGTYVINIIVNSGLPSSTQYLEQV